MNQCDFGVPDVRCYDRALFAAVKCLTLYCRSQIFCIKAASGKTREKSQRSFSSSSFFFPSKFAVGLNMQMHRIKNDSSKRSPIVYLCLWCKDKKDKMIFSWRLLSPHGQQIACGLKTSLSARLNWSAHPDKDCEDIIIRPWFTYHWPNGHVTWSI